MRREQDGGIPVLRGYQVSVVISGDFKAKGLKAAGELLRDCLLLPGGTVDAHQVAEGVGEPLATNHGDFLLGHGLYTLP